jgi:hypothetical protein
MNTSVLEERQEHGPLFTLWEDSSAGDTSVIFFMHTMTITENLHVGTEMYECHYMVMPLLLINHYKCIYVATKNRCWPRPDF